MELTIKSIETSYRGYRFRSRLEARWAVFFDTLGISYEYEPQGFEIKAGSEGGTEVIRYLPDFYLSEHKLWVEVKGSDEMLQVAKPCLESFLKSSNISDDDKRSPAILILGNIPDPTLWGVHLHRMAYCVSHTCGKNNLVCVFDWIHFLPNDMEGVRGAYMFTNLFGDEPYPDWTTRSLHVPTRRAWTEVRDAYKAARSARFEHGEAPIVIE